VLIGPPIDAPGANGEVIGVAARLSTPEDPDFASSFAAAA
jgi:hypothetical protein